MINDMPRKERGLEGKRYDSSSEASPEAPALYDGSNLKEDIDNGSDSLL